MLIIHHLLEFEDSLTIELSTDILLVEVNKVKPNGVRIDMTARFQRVSALWDHKFLAVAHFRDRFCAVPEVFLRGRSGFGRRK